MLQVVIPPYSVCRTKQSQAGSIRVVLHEFMLLCSTDTMQHCCPVWTAVAVYTSYEVRVHVDWRMFARRLFDENTKILKYSRNVPELSFSTSMSKNEKMCKTQKNSWSNKHSPQISQKSQKKSQKRKTSRVVCENWPHSKARGCRAGRVAVIVQISSGCKTECVRYDLLLQDAIFLIFVLTHSSKYLVTVYSSLIAHY